MKFSEKDVIKLSWKEVESDLSKIYKKIIALKLKIDYIVPIMRGGMVPAAILSHKLDVYNIIPVQYKYINEGGSMQIKKLIDFSFKSNDKRVFLVIEGNHSTGRIANEVISGIKRLNPNSKIIYVSLTRDYFYKDSVKGADFSISARYSNENRKLNLKECKKLKISFDKFFIFPWEKTEEEIGEFNGGYFK